jgi:hypothetical protein
VAFGLERLARPLCRGQRSRRVVLAQGNAAEQQVRRGLPGGCPQGLEQAGRFFERSRASRIVGQLGLGRSQVQERAGQLVLVAGSAIVRGHLPGQVARFCVPAQGQVALGQVAAGPSGRFGESIGGLVDNGVQPAQRARIVTLRAVEVGQVDFDCGLIQAFATLDKERPGALGVSLGLAQIAQDIVGKANVGVQRAKILLPGGAERLGHRQGRLKPLERQARLPEIVVHKRRLEVEAQEPLGFAQAGKNGAGGLRVGQGLGDAVEVDAEVQAPDGRSGPAHLVARGLVERARLVQPLPGLVESAQELERITLGHAAQRHRLVIGARLPDGQDQAGERQRLAGINRPIAIGLQLKPLHDLAGGGCQPGAHQGLRVPGLLQQLEQALDFGGARR